MSGFGLISDSGRRLGHVRKVPTTEVMAETRRNKKPPEGGFSN
jgi:hypothetical protein